MQPAAVSQENKLRKPMPAHLVSISLIRNASSVSALAAADSRPRCPSSPDSAFEGHRSSHMNQASRCLPWTSRFAGSAAFAPRHSMDPERLVGPAFFGDHSREHRLEQRPIPGGCLKDPGEAQDYPA